MILFDQPFRTGDMVQVGETYGEVVNIGLRSVRIHTFDDSTVTLPNSLVLSQAVKNSNSGALDEMVVVEFCLPATADVQRVKALAREAGASSPYAFLKKPISVVVEDALDRTFLTRFKVKCYVLDVRLERVLASDVTERIKVALVEQGLPGDDAVLGLLAARRA
ncbi:MAG: mechanosensitive ion channel family protein [Deferrisomatales bacterium]